MFLEYSCCKAFKSSQCLLGEHSKEEREGDGRRGVKGDGNQRIEIGMAKRVSAESRKQRAESRN